MNDKSKRCMDAMYICTTPYQIISALAISSDQHEDADIYIDPQFENANVFIDKLKSSSSFNRVIDLSGLFKGKTIRHPNRFIRAWRIFITYLFANKLIKRIVPKGITYKKMYSTGVSFYALLFEHCMRKNERISIIHFEDGEGTYDDIYYSGGSFSYIKKLFPLKKTYCDRCGKEIYYDPQQQAIFPTYDINYVAQHSFYQPNYFDLCNNCQIEFSILMGKWLKGTIEIKIDG